MAFNKIRIRVEMGRLREVTVDGTPLNVALDGLRLELQDGVVPVLRVSLLAIDLEVDGDLQAIITNATPDASLADTRYGMALQIAQKSSVNVQSPNDDVWLPASGDVAICNVLGRVADAMLDAPVGHANVDS